MKILHICLGGPVTDDWTYQENLLSKYHSMAGHDVTIFAARQIWGTDGKLTLSPSNDYIDANGVHIIRLANRFGTTITSKIRFYKNLYKQLEKYAPDIIFIHGVQFPDVRSVARYLRKHPEVTAYLDNHADFSNSASNWISRKILHGILWKHYAGLITPYIKKFYGVLPARVDFLHDLYGIPKEKIDLLVMGADDEMVRRAEDPAVKKALRQKYGIAEDDFLIVTGGKIDIWKKQTLFLMDAVNRMNNPKVKLIVFGSVADELKKQVHENCSDKVQYIGWIKGEDSYDHFAAADLAVFPGRHSVFWEQVAGQGIPMVVKRWPGTEHTDIGGNTVYLDNDSVQELQNVLDWVILPENYFKMKEAAEKAKTHFLYSNIAARCINPEEERL